MRKITLDNLSATRIDHSMANSEVALDAIILLVDPRPAFLNILSASFRQRGFKKIMLATNTRDAFDAIRYFTPGLIVVGHVEDDSDNDHLLRTIRQNTILKSTTTIVITTDELKTKVQETYKLTDDAVVCKPVDLGQLTTIAFDRLAEQSLRDSILAKARLSRSIPASEKYRRLRKIVGRQ